MKVKIRFERGRDCVIGPTFGPYEFVQVTYALLRDDKDNDIACQYARDDDWTLIESGEKYSDFIIEAVEEAKK